MPTSKKHGQRSGVGDVNHNTSASALRPVMIMAGGTGGHVFPALAVAEEIRARNIPVIWLGTRQGIESRVVPEAGFVVEWVNVSGLRGKRFTRIMTAPFMLLNAAWQCFRILLRNKPRVVLGMGGFVTGPAGVIARMMGTPLCIHEQNAIAGMTNRYLSKLTRCVMQAFPNTFPDHLKATTTGNPVRESLTRIEAPESRLMSRQGRARLLVVGGSLGAQALNTVIPQALAEMPEAMRPLVRHQTGERNREQAEQQYQLAGIKDGVEIVPFIDDMATAYEWADLVVCRAGALTITELSTVGIGSILVPYPHAVDDHQTRNADLLVNAGAALLIPQDQLDARQLGQQLQGLFENREKLLQMAKAARAQAKPHATQQVADICVKASLSL